MACDFGWRRLPTCLNRLSDAQNEDFLWEMLPPQVMLRKCGLSLVLCEPPQGRLQGKAEEVSRCTQLLFAVVICAPSFVHLLSNHWRGVSRSPGDLKN